MAQLSCFWNMPRMPAYTLMYLSLAWQVRMLDVYFQVLAGKTYCSMLIILLQSFPELPGLLLSAVIVDRVGRKISMAIMSILTFIFLLPLLIHQPVTLTTVLLFGARMFANGTFAVACVYAPEVCPRLSSDYFLSQHSICLTCPH